MNLGPLGDPVCLSCGASPAHHQPDCAGDETWEAANPPLQRRRGGEELSPSWLQTRAGRALKANGRSEVLQALRNFADAHEWEALDETNPDARRGRLFVIEHLRALIAVEAIRP